VRSGAVLGIDASLRALGLFVCPLDWDLQPSRCAAYTLGVDLPKDATATQYVERLRMLSVDIVKVAYMHHVTECFIESYAYGMKTAAHSLGEIGGVIKLDLWREKRIAVQTANQGAARKFVYGMTPPRGMKDVQRKAWLFEPIRLAGLPVEDHNQSDAAVVAMYGLSELGAPTFCHLLGEPEVKAKRARKARSQAA
jgi:hypothetical protein